MLSTFHSNNNVNIKNNSKQKAIGDYNNTKYEEDMSNGKHLYH